MFDTIAETAVIAVSANSRMNPMITMTSLVAQNQFGNLIDSSQRQPVTITRRGRPVVVVQSYEDYIASKNTIPSHVAKIISEQYPLQGADAAHAMHTQLASMDNRAAEEGLTEDDVMRILNEE